MHLHRHGGNPGAQIMEVHVRVVCKQRHRDAGIRKALGNHQRSLSGGGEGDHRLRRDAVSFRIALPINPPWHRPPPDQGWSWWRSCGIARQMYSAPLIKVKRPAAAIAKVWPSN